MAKTRAGPEYRQFVEMMCFIGHAVLYRRAGSDDEWEVHYGGPFKWKSFEYRLMLEEEMA